MKYMNVIMGLMSLISLVVCLIEGLPEVSIAMNAGAFVLNVVIVFFQYKRGQFKRAQ